MWQCRMNMWQCRTNMCSYSSDTRRGAKGYYHGFSSKAFKFIQVYNVSHHPHHSREYTANVALLPRHIIKSESDISS